MRLHRLFIPFALAFASESALAGRITAELDRTDGEVGESFGLTVAVEGSLEGEVQVADVPGLVIETQGHSQRMTIVNGQRTSEVSVTYVIRPQQAGEFVIPSIKAVVDENEEATLPLKLRVKPAGQGQQGQAQQGQGGGGGKTANKAQDPDTGGVFIERECDGSTPYVGEQVVCTIRIFHRGNLNGGQRPGVSSADFRRFSVEGENRYQRVVNGQRYAVIELKDVVVPTKAGKLELPPFVLEARVLTWSKRGNPLDKFLGRLGGGVFNFDMSFTEEKQVKLESEPTAFDVKALPEEGKPQGFSGLVGDFELSASLGQSPVKTGETTTVAVTLAGRGLLDTIAEPVLALKDVGKVYPDKPEYKETITAEQGVQSSKTFRYALVPAKEGSFPLGAVAVPAFSPRLGQYVTLTADVGTLVVQQGDAPEQPLAVGQGPAAPSQAAVSALGEDLLPMHGLDKLKSEQTITRNLAWILITTATSPWLFSFGLMSLRGLRRRREGSADLRKSRALRAYQEGLSQARALTETGRIDEAVATAHRAFRDLIGAKIDRHGAALTAKEIEAALVTLAASDSVRAEAARLIGFLEQVEFGGRRLAKDDVQAVIRDLGGVASALEVL